jgi:hypothetical protein
VELAAADAADSQQLDQRCGAHVRVAEQCRDPFVGDGDAERASTLPQRASSPAPCVVRNAACA